MEEAELPHRLHGVTGVAVSPFTDDGTLDPATLQWLSQRADLAGVHAMTALGNTAEVFQLTDEERISSLRAIRTGIRQAATIAGIPCGYGESRGLIAEAERLGYDALMFHEPMDPLASEAGILTRWKQMLALTTLPTIPYIRTGRLSADAVAEIANHPQVIAVKLARPAALAADIIATAGRDACVWIAGGAEAQFLTVRDLGIRGFTSGLVSVAPELSLGLWAAAEAGDEVRVAELAVHIVGIEDLRAREHSRWNVAAVKAALRLTGIDVGEVRAPCEPLTPVAQRELEAIVATWPRTEQTRTDLTRTDQTRTEQARTEQAGARDRSVQPNRIQRDQHSPYCDLIHIPSSRDPEVRIAVRIIKPPQPGTILVGTHGFHQNVPDFMALEQPEPGLEHLKVEVDMRGRKYSTGHADCNGWELHDVIDAIDYVQQHYAEHISDLEGIHFQAGSGGGGNALALAGKYPDRFASITALYGISDYAAWFDGDRNGEFRPTLTEWIGTTPNQNRTAYATRSGIDLLPNLLTPVYLAHGDQDDRVPVTQSRAYVARAAELGKQSLVTYDELPGMGAQGNHRGAATPEQQHLLTSRPAAHRSRHRTAPALPIRGRLIVAGFLYTKRFSVVLDSLDSMAVIDYDLTAGQFRVVGQAEGSYQLIVNDGAGTEVA